MPRSRIRPARLARSIAPCWLLLAGCQTADPLVEDVERLRGLPPAPFTVAVALVDESARALNDPNDEGYPLLFGDDEDPCRGLQRALATELRWFDAASRVLVLDAEQIEDAVLEAVHRGADVVVLPRVAETAVLQADGVSGQVWLSGLLWLTTWIGGLLIDDYTYAATARVDFDIVDPHAGLATDDEVLADSVQFDLAFFDRNSFLSLGTAMALVLPPFLTVDDHEATGRELSRRIANRLAARLTGFLKEELALLCEFEMVRPDRNGRTLAGAGPLDLAFRIAAPAEISELVVVPVDAAGAPTSEPTRVDLPAAGAQSAGARYEVRPELSLAQPTEQTAFLKLEFRIGGQLTSRTLRLVRDPAEAAP